MPIGKYFKGAGQEVMAGMRKQYGKRAKEVFYATANKRGMKPVSHGSMHIPADIGAARRAEAQKVCS